MADKLLITHLDIADESLLVISNFCRAHAEYINPQTTTYEKMVNPGKIYDISNDQLVNDISRYCKAIRHMEGVTNKEGNQYHVVWNGPDLVNFWYLKNLSNDLPRLRKVGHQLLDKDGSNFKHLINIVGWGNGMTNRNLDRIEGLRELNTKLQSGINSYLK